MSGVVVNTGWCGVMAEPMRSEAMRLIDNDEHWQERAKEARALAEQMDDAEAKHTMLEIAQCYVLLAERAKRHKAKRGNSS